MKETIDELLGSKRGVADSVCDSGIKNRIKNLFVKLLRKEQRLQVVNQAGVYVNLIVVTNNREDIAQVIMEMNGNINNKQQ